MYYSNNWFFYSKAGSFLEENVDQNNSGRDNKARLNHPCFYIYGSISDLELGPYFPLPMPEFSPSCEKASHTELKLLLFVKNK